MLLGAGLTFSAPLYSFSMMNPRMLMLITAEDQQLGGLLMWIVGSIYFLVLASIFFLSWMLQQEKAHGGEGNDPSGLHQRGEEMFSEVPDDERAAPGKSILVPERQQRCF